AISLVRSLAVASRRQLYVWKNDKVRVREVCRGKCPEFTNGPDVSGLNSPNRGKLKQVNGKWIKCQKVQTSCSGQGINNVGVKQIKIEDIVKPNPEIPRDYVLELQRTNEDTTVKIDLERDYNPNETTRQFKRIYFCIRALKRGFKEGLRELLGLDGCFMKGQYPGQLLTVVGIDANHGIYPLSYAIVETENTHSWSWFLTCLRDDLDLNPMSNFTFISDRQKGIQAAIAQVFPKAQWKGNQFKELVWKCVAATTVQYFDKKNGKVKELR
ncbi:mutator type transposase, partial [Tanacetum coccineum]